MSGPAELVNALRHTRGITTADVIGGLIRRAELVTRPRRDGEYYDIYKNIPLDAGTAKILEETDERLKRVLSAMTWNRLPNIGACMLRDRFGRKVDGESIREMKEWLGIG